ncbi:hypothetical protein [Tolypothrix sp. VBCCA 56010]|uniref:hypothetical protein n=1 Tax=Tolypothrix sp. VBCCA 56010 TaxID=3137731 RepID=UPI003D7E7132
MTNQPPSNPPPAGEKPLDHEMAVYAKNLPNWVDREGQFVVIFKDEVLGFFNDFGDALQVGYTKAGPKTAFLVKRVMQNEKPIFIRGCVA